MRADGAGETVEHSQVRIIGPLNLPSAMPIHASQLYARNMHNLIGHITEDRAEEKEEHDLHPNLDFEDEIVATCASRTAVRSGTKQLARRSMRAPKRARQARACRSCSRRSPSSS